MSRGLERPSSSSALRVRSGPAADQALDLAGDPLGLLFLVVGLEALDRPATGLLGPQLLVGCGPCSADDGVGRVEDQLRGAVVLLELDDRGVRLVALEVEDVAQVGAAPRVDRLVVVADDAQVVVAARPAPAPTGTGPGWCPGIRRRGGSASDPGSGPGRPAPPRRGAPPRAGCRRSEVISAATAWPGFVPSKTKFCRDFRCAYGPSTTTNSGSSISQLPFLLRFSRPSSPAPPGRTPHLH